MGSEVTVRQDLRIDMVNELINTEDWFAVPVFLYTTLVITDKQRLQSISIVSACAPSAYSIQCNTVQLSVELDDHLVPLWGA
jgi:hypothetical protein